LQGVIQALQSMANATQGSLSVSADGTPEPNIALVNAPALWTQGYTEQGAVVASLDTGVDVNHPDLSARWRGGSNSWFDPLAQSPVGLIRAVCVQ
jgi:subtilisin family serine protease